MLLVWVGAAGGFGVICTMGWVSCLSLRYPPPLSLSTQLIVVHTDCVCYHLAFHVVRFASLLRAVSLLFDELLCLSTLCCRGMFVHWCLCCCFHYGMERCSYSRITFCFVQFWLGNIALSVIRPGCYSIRFSVKMITITFAARAGRLTVFGRLCPLWVVHAQCKLVPFMFEIHF